MKTSAPLVTIYIPCHNYRRFVREAIESVLRQSFHDWELIVVDDGSTDDSFELIQKYEEYERIRVLRNDEAQGLRQVANACIAMARGRFVMRLDADDILHPRCIELLIEAVEQDEDIDLVFSDFYYVDDVGEVRGVELLPSSDTGEYQASTFPPHGACSLIRRELLTRVGSYSETVSRQDGHELWLKLLQASATSRHVALPLFFYRKHGPSLSSDLQGLLDDRAHMKRQLAEKLETKDRVVAVIPVKNTYDDMPDLPFRRYEGECLIDTAIKAAAGVAQITDIIVTCDSESVAEYVAQLEGPITVIERSPDLLRDSVNMADILRDALGRCSIPDETVICWLNVNCPRRLARHVQKALDNFFLYRPDSVVSVYEEQNLMYQMGDGGLRPLNSSYQYSLRREREAVYVDAGAVRVFRARNLRSPHYLGERIGHALMTREDAVQIRSADDLTLLDPYEPAEQVVIET